VTRLLKDWIPSFMDYTTGTEAPRLMHFWVGVSAIAGTLRRRVWIDMKRFQWFPNFYIILVAPPGIISKTTTMDMSMDLLKRVPGIKFGPDIVTWQSLVEKFADCTESFQYGEDWYPMSPLTLASGELGNLIDPFDKNMINLYITLWDSRKTLEKSTKSSGCDMIEAPWINMIGCTTPHWIADNMPAATVGGGFTSRCIFVYGDKKENLIAYPDEFVKVGYEEYQDRLVNDLEHMATNLCGPFTITEEGRVWGREWYRDLWVEKAKTIDSDQLNGYLARKQTHMHKLGLILSASRGDSQEITLDDLVLADQMLVATEELSEKVFARIGRTEDSLQSERLVNFIRRHGTISYQKAYQHVHSFFPDFREFEGVLAGAIRSGQIKMSFNGPDPTRDAVLIYVGA
jgi:hypothetical protein